jgi:hypothetical protein
VCATKSPALADVPTLNRILNVDRVSPANPAVNRCKETASSAADNPVSLGNKANQAVSPVKAVNQVVSKAAKPVKVVNPVRAVKAVKAEASVLEARQVNPAERLQVMLGTASPVRLAMPTAAAIAMATGMAPMTPAILASPVRPWRPSKVPTRPIRSARLTRD